MAGVIHVERTDNYLDAAGTLRLDYLATWTRWLRLGPRRGRYSSRQ